MLNAKKLENGLYEVNCGSIKVIADRTRIKGLADRLSDALNVFNERAETTGVSAELGHPAKSVDDPNFTIKRGVTIDEQHTCAIIKNAQIRDEELLLRVSPAGPYGDLLTEALDTPGGPAFFGMRALYSHVGDELITLKIVTWDLVSGKP